MITVGYAQNNHQPDDARFFASNNLAFPRRDFLALGGFDPSYRTSEDRDLCARWVLSGRKLVYVPEAVVGHANPLTFSGFWRQNFTYGQGAFRFHRDQAQRVGRARSRSSRPSTGLSSARRGARAARCARSLVALWLLCVWHVANTLGFLHGWWRCATSEPQESDVLHVAWSGRVGGIERLVEGYVRAASVREGPVISPVSSMAVGRSATRWPQMVSRIQLKLRAGWDIVGPLAIHASVRKCPAAGHGHVHARTRCPASRRRGRSPAREPHLPGVLGARLQSGREVPPALSRAQAHDLAVRRPDGRCRAGDPQPRCRSERSVRVVPNGVSVARDVTGSGSKNGKPVVGIVGRLEQQKRIDLYLDVLAALRARNVELAGIVVGDGSLKSRLMAEADTQGLGGIVEFAGEQADVTPWLDRLDVFLMTSAVETFGMAAAEAMARGVPVVAMPSESGLDDLVRSRRRPARRS